MGSGVPLPIEGGVWGGAVPRNLKKLGLLWRLLVDSGGHSGCYAA